MGVRIMDNVVPEGLIKRQQYEQFLIKKYGNPYVSQNDVSREVDRIASENDETLFRHLFGDRYRYADRGRLDPQAQAYYQRGQLTLRKNIEKSIGGDLKGKVAQHTQRMSIYDKYSGRKAPALKKVARPEGTVWGTPKAGEKVYEPPDKELKKFESLYPKWKGKRGSEGYRKKLFEYLGKRKGSAFGEFMNEMETKVVKGMTFEKQEDGSWKRTK